MGFLSKNPNIKKILYIFILLAIGNVTIYQKYWYPPAQVWDESYHISSAAKYVKGVFFMEPHPPLGKLLIAAGEMLTNLNHGVTNNIERVEKIPHYSSVFPEGFSFAGYRLFPALFGWANVVIFGLLLYELLGSYVFALAFACFYAFDNSIISNTRIAVLESFVLFGFLVCLWGFFKLFNLNQITKRNYLWPSFLMVFGFSFSVLTKSVGLALLVLWPMLFYFKKEERKSLVKIVCGQILFFTVFFLSVWQVHFSLAKRFDSILPFNGQYYMSSETEKALLQLPDSIGPIQSYFSLLKDNLRYFTTYESRVVHLDLSTGDSNGSFPIMWPFGSRPMAYRWNIDDPELKQYAYAIPNPPVWGTGLFSLIFSIGLLFAASTFGVKGVRRETIQKLVILVVLYFSFMLPFLSIRRILYLYHYFSPLLCTILMGALIWRELFVTSSQHALLKNLKFFSMAVFFAVFAFYIFISPVTYYSEVTCEEANSRAIFRFWDLRFKGCVDPALRSSDNVHLVPDTRLRPFSDWDL